MRIQEEKIEDINSTYNLIKLAFETAEHSDGTEQNLVARLRESESFVPKLNLVCKIDNILVGHIMFTEIKIGNSISLALAPLSILPDYQRKGIGKALILEGIQIAKKLDYPSIVVLGSEKYYPKFGFKEASIYDITAPFPVPSKNFMVLNLKDNNISGTVEYAKEFF